ncbi:toll/interleukin-1 receptor domain-containing protein [Promicromonospora sp. NPDC060271]|uniref:toll/interleukin-1 receptor domain-containing protein n=1 Tax=Promicromonospora sp. NPDC060271 TaxID=3347089 RepID=UPI003661480C
MARYDAFLSYSHADDGDFGPRLQSLLEGFARPGPRRALRVFRDEQNLAADPDLWGSIERALVDSEWFVLLASPAAARSPWVDKEVAWWLEHRSADRLVVALTAAGPDIHLPPALRSPGVRRPVVVDLTAVSRSGPLDPQDPLVQRTVAELAGPLHGRPVPDLIAADAARRRRAASSAVSAGVVLTLLIAGAVGAGRLATAQADRADAETQVATAHLLATTALAAAATDLERAALLAVEGYRLHPDTQTLTALLRSVNGSNAIGARALVGAEVIAAAAAPDATAAPAEGPGAGAVIVATEAGEILRWDLRGAPVRLTTLDARPSALATSGDGTVIAVATTGTNAAVWLHADDQTRKVHDGEAVDVTVDPSGERYAVVRWQTAAHTVSIRATADDTVVADADLSRTVYDAVRLQDDTAVLHQRWTNGGLGPWQRRSLPDLDVLDEGTVLDGDLADEVGSDVATAQATTTDGSWVMTQLDDAVHGVRTEDGTTVTVPVPTALGTFPPSVMALSPSGGNVLLARRDEVWMVRLSSSGWEHRAERLEGVGTPDAAVFLDDRRLVMTHGRTLTAWDVGSADALAETAVVEGGTAHDRALTPDGATVVSAGERPGAAPAGGDEGRLLAMTHTFDGEEPGTDGLDVRPAGTALLGDLSAPAGERLLPVPLADGTHLFVDAEDGSVFGAGGAPVDETAGETADDTVVPPLEPLYETRPGRVLDAVGHEGRLVLAGANGAVQVRDARTGDLLAEAAAPADAGFAAQAARISPDGRFVAFHHARTSDRTLRDARIQVLEVATSTVHTHELTAGRLTSRANDRFWRSEVELVFGDDYLAAAHAGGIAVLDRDGRTVRREIAAPTSGRQNTVAPVPGTTLVAVAGDADWIRLFDTTTGEEVGHLSALAGSADGDSPLWLAAGRDTLWAVGPRYLTRWDARPARLHAQACEFAARNLTADEWRQASGGARPPADLTCERPLESR